MSVQGSGDIMSVHVSPNMHKVSCEEDREMESLASYDQIAAYAASVYAGLGSSYNEKIYHQGLLQKLHYFNISHETEKVIPVLYRRKQIGVVRADIIVQNHMVVELKCVAKVTSAHYEQALRYAQLLGLNHAILINVPTTSDAHLQIFAFVQNAWVTIVPVYPNMQQ